MANLTDKETYLARAAEARIQGDEATLENVRERCRRSEAAWTAMAERAERNERMRATLAAQKAAAEAATAENEPIKD
jgi:hypothetical protein